MADAPLKSLRADLGLVPGKGKAAPSASLPFAGDFASPAALRARLKKVEDAMVSLRADLQAQAQDLVGIATGFARTDARVFIQNTSTAAVHYAKPNDNRSTAC